MIVAFAMEYWTILGGAARGGCVVWGKWAQEAGAAARAVRWAAILGGEMDVGCAAAGLCAQQALCAAC